MYGGGQGLEIFMSRKVLVKQIGQTKMDVFQNITSPIGCPVKAGCCMRAARKKERTVRHSPPFPTIK